MAHNASRSSPSRSARNRTVTGTMYGPFHRPRNGIGVMNGASVSTNNNSRGHADTASRNVGAFLNVTFPAKLI